MCARINKGYSVFDRYYTKTDASSLYAAALILNPTYNTHYIKDNWETKWVKPALKSVEKLWETYREEAHGPLITLSYDGLTSRPLTKKPLEKELDVFDQIAHGLKKHTRPSSQDEYQDYQRFDSYDLGKTTALQWWSQEQHRKRWPRLSLMALDILSIPPMSDEPERVFSGARRTISWERMRLGGPMIEATECLKHWKRSGILNKILSS